jgi:hypothetical protein
MTNEAGTSKDSKTDSKPGSNPGKAKPSLRRRLWRICFRLGIAGFVLVLLTFGTSYFWIDPAVSKAVEVAGADAVGTTVTLGKVTLDVFNGAVDLSELRIDNPPGFEKPYFFDMKKAQARVRLSTVLENEIVLPEVILEGLTLYLEPNDDGDYNHEIILANIEKYTAAGEAEAEASGDITVRIERLVMRDIKVYYKTKVFVNAPVHLKEKVLTDVGSDGEGVTIGQVLSIVIMGALTGTAKELPSAIGKGIWNGTKAIGGAFKGAGIGITGGFKSIFGIGKKKNAEEKPEETPEENAKEDDEEDK